MIRVRIVVSEKDLRRAFAIRVRVFVREQGVPMAIEIDRDDRIATHLIAEIDGRAVGAARLVIKRGKAKIGRMAVLKTCRGRGVGAALLRRAIALARRSGAKIIYLHAQVAVAEFYETMGFRPVGPIFSEARIPHRKMILPRSARRAGRGAKRAASR